jgi:kynurenine formamidase
MTGDVDIQLGSLGSARLVDLSVEIRSGPGTLPPPAKSETRISQYRMTGAIHWQGSHITTTTHVGSHVDSPLHVAAGAPTIGEIGLERVIGPAVVLNLTPVEPNQPIDTEDLAPFLDRVAPGDIAVLRTDWTDRAWGTAAYWADSPFLTEDGAAALAERRPKAVAFDFFEERCARYESFRSEEFVVHLLLLKEHDILLIENITHLSSLRSDRVVLFAAPLNIQEAEGAPARVFALEVAD